MNLEEVLNLVDNALCKQTGKNLTALQKEIFQGSWNGETYPAIADVAYCTEGHVRDVAAELWRELSEVLGEKVGKKSFKRILEQKVNSGELLPLLGEVPQQRCDWGDAPDVELFLGRTAELDTLQQWIVEDNCRLVTLLGIGGIGKTSTAAKLVHLLESEFELIIWRSLRNAPDVLDILAELIQFLSQQQETALPDRLDGKILRLLEYLRASSCLVILDNVESILASGVRTGSYREGYQGYGQFFKAVGETSHQSCLVVTSREKPQGLSSLEGETLPVRSLQLTGLPSEIGQEICDRKGSFTASPAQWQTLNKRYGGNPLALKIVASAIADWFDGDITRFLEILEQDSFLFDDLDLLLGEQFDRLTAREREIMYWLAINREPVSIQELTADLVIKISPSEILQALASLQRRSLIEKTVNSMTQQPVVMEYVTNEFIKKVSAEIVSGEINFFNSHALIKAQAPDYVRETQIRLILQPVIQQAIAILDSPENLSNYLNQFLDKLRSQSKPVKGYAGGNIINLLCQLGVNLTGYDFSRLTIWQADLQEVNLRSVNFAYSDLARSVFSEALESILSVAVSPDGQLLGTGDVNGQIRLWQMPSGKPLLTIKGHDNWIRSVTFSPDGQILASGSYDRTLKLWDINNANCIRTYTGHNHGVASVAFSPDGQILASGSYDRTLKLWSVSNGKGLRTFAEHTDWVNSVAFSSNNKILASGSADCTIKLWDIGNGKCLKTYTGHNHGISSVAFSPIPINQVEGVILATGSADCTIKLWSLRSDRCIKTLKGHREWINSIAFSHDGRILASGSADHTVKLWDVRSGVCLQTCIGHSNAVWSVAFHLQNQIIISGSFDQTVRLWSSHTGNCLKTFAGSTNWVRSVVFSNDGQTLVSGHTDHQVRIWDIKSGKCLQTLSGHTAQVCAVASHNDANIIASGSYDETIKLWSSDPGKNLNTLIGHSGWVCSVAFNNDGKTLASGGFDHTVKLWDLESGDCLKTFIGHDNVVWSVVISPDGKTLATASADNSIKLWDLESGDCLKTFIGHDNVVWSVVISPDGKTLATASADNLIKLWDINNGGCLKTFTGHQNWVFSIAFSPNGQTLASGSHDRTVKLWDLKTGDCLKTFTGHSKEVYSVSFNSGGIKLASGSQDGTIKLWNLKTDKCFKTLRAARLYEGMNITGAIGLTEAQKATLTTLGAREIRVEQDV
ncbi:MAG: NB-ARC domain-containing protein [Pleurocapsa sp. MO_226.B13]|nr:NB-ARC domain-containing protein [Pleurocapsa sp. MO_226.B13]